MVPGNSFPGIGSEPIRFKGEMSWDVLNCCRSEQLIAGLRGIFSSFDLIGVS